uniref:Uncharacterized protein n=1 Tax=Chromera velia CCMP2878 TaxID=1169474 RepID=A0A0G4F6U1_9ALVE|eukprot:Cvel_2897.t1-p1 / transcript=Cvel_2897.t1 / gene=Cvel_2897 / organism=Chromera_velia_CCMP2878 / gene_product=hypothetical protein / transcript_product=hypothetical protein / location=Cvel_scaffold114:103156-109008(+) / protein_length=837 / sequence_SO=supercontig / SO=protein_coding / is_pseudo=false
MSICLLRGLIAKPRSVSAPPVALRLCSVRRLLSSFPANTHDRKRERGRHPDKGLSQGWGGRGVQGFLESVEDLPDDSDDDGGGDGRHGDGYSPSPSTLARLREETEFVGDPQAFRDTWHPGANSDVTLSPGGEAQDELCGAFDEGFDMEKLEGDLPRLPALGNRAEIGAARGRLRNTTLTQLRMVEERLKSQAEKEQRMYRGDGERHRGWDGGLKKIALRPSRSRKDKSPFVKIRVLDVDRLPLADVHRLFMFAMVRCLPAETCVKVASRVGLYRDKQTQTSYEQMHRHCAQYFGRHGAELSALFSRCYATISVTFMLDYTRRFGQFSRAFIAKQVQRSMRTRLFDFLRFARQGGVPTLPLIVTRPWALSSYVRMMSKSSARRYIYHQLKRYGQIPVRSDGRSSESREIDEGRLMERMAEVRKGKPTMEDRLPPRPALLEAYLEAEHTGRDIQEVLEAQAVAVREQGEIEREREKEKMGASRGLLRDPDGRGLIASSSRTGALSRGEGSKGRRSKVKSRGMETSLPVGISTDMRGDVPTGVEDHDEEEEDAGSFWAEEEGDEEALESESEMEEDDEDFSSSRPSSFRGGQRAEEGEDEEMWREDEEQISPSRGHILSSSRCMSEGVHPSLRDTAAQFTPVALDLPASYRLGTEADGQTSTALLVEDDDEPEGSVRLAGYGESSRAVRGEVLEDGEELQGEQKSLGRGGDYGDGVRGGSLPLLQMVQEEAGPSPRFWKRTSRFFFRFHKKAYRMVEGQWKQVGDPRDPPLTILSIQKQREKNRKRERRRFIRRAKERAVRAAEEAGILDASDRDPFRQRAGEQKLWRRAKRKGTEFPP